MKRERITENRRNNREYNDDRFFPRATEEARAYTKKKARRTNILLSAAALSLVAVIAAGIFFFSSSAAKPTVKTSDTPTIGVTKVVDTKTAANTDETAARQTSTQAPAAAQEYTASQSDDQQTSVQPAQSDDSQSSDSNTPAQTPTQSDDDSDGNIQIINGQRVYIDTNHPAPANTGTPLHCSATGKTSYGFDWTYDTDNGNIVVACNYNFDTQQYDFIVYGAAEGTAHVTLYYNTSDGVQAPLPVTVNVDSDLNATQG